MNLSAFTLIFEAVFVVLLLVTIVYAVKLNTRISGLRERDSEIREMIKQFHEASDQALDSVRVLKTAGLDADREIKESIDRAEALRDDLADTIERGERIANRIEHAPLKQQSTQNRESSPVGAAEPHEPPPESTDEDGRYRSEIEQALAQIVRSTAMAG